MNRLIITLAVMLWLLHSTGCMGGWLEWPWTFTKDDIPCAETFWAEVEKPWVLHEYDCSQKASAYWWALKDAGYDPVLWVVWVRENDNPYRPVPRRTIAHAVVQVGNRYFDPTSGEYGIKNLLAWGRPIRIATEYEIRIDDEWRLPQRP